MVEGEKDRKQHERPDTQPDESGKECAEGDDPVRIDAGQMTG
jgi:hypothetical protein